jgi:tripartite-type tricarboxylate transporter receptor subunit TctC
MGKGNLKTFLRGGSAGFGVFSAIMTFSLLTGISSASTHEFFRGKSLRIVVSFSPGGGFDVYSRAIARHISKYIPGNPVVIVENLPGAGGLVAANRLYRSVKPDGLTLGNFPGGLFMEQFLGRAGIEFDARKFEYVGVPVKDIWVCVLAKSTGITSIEKWMKSTNPVKLGATGPGSSTYITPRLLHATLNLPIQVVSGYKGVADVRLAADSGELDGGCTSWEGTRVSWGTSIQQGNAAVILQITSNPHPELQKVPLAIKFVKNDEDRLLLQVAAHDLAAINRAYVLPPETPKDRVKLLRDAFVSTLKDPEFLMEVKKSKMEVDPMTGEEMENVVARIFNLEVALANRLKVALR